MLTQAVYIVMVRKLNDLRNKKMSKLKNGFKLISAYRLSVKTHQLSSQQSSTIQNKCTLYVHVFLTV